MLVSLVRKFADRVLVRRLALEELRWLLLDVFLLDARISLVVPVPDVFFSLLLRHLSALITELKV